MEALPIRNRTMAAAVVASILVAGIINSDAAHAAGFNTNNKSKVWNKIKIPLLHKAMVAQIPQLSNDEVGEHGQIHGVMVACGTCHSARTTQMIHGEAADSIAMVAVDAHSSFYGATSTLCSMRVDVPLPADADLDVVRFLAPRRHAGVVVLVDAATGRRGTFGDLWRAMEGAASAPLLSLHKGHVALILSPISVHFGLQGWQGDAVAHGFRERRFFRCLSFGRCSGPHLLPWDPPVLRGLHALKLRALI